MSQNENVYDECALFCEEIRDLLRATICEHVPIRWSARPDGQVVIGDPLDGNWLRSTPMRVRTASEEAILWLSILYRLKYDDRNFFTVISSVWALTMGDDGHDEFLHFDYEREKSGYTGAHVQINAKNEGFAALMTASGRPGRGIDRIHLPVGGKRYRPALEDVIEFLVDEKIAVMSDEVAGRNLLQEKREKFRKKQLKAAVANDPEVAREALDELSARVAAGQR